MGKGNETLGEVITGRPGLVKKWDKVLAPIREVHKQKRNREISLWNEVQVAQCLDNLASLLKAKKEGRAIFEDTKTTDIASLSRFGFPVIAAALPALASLDVCGMQAMSLKHGAVYYMNYLGTRVAEKKFSVMLAN